MKQQFEQSREGLISHIEIKLSQLKQQRDSILTQTNQPKPPGKIKISNYLQTQNNIQSQKDKDQSIPLDAPQVLSKTDMLQHRLAAKQKCEELKQLYENKRQLQQAGIYEANPDKIKKIYQNKDAVDKIKKDLIKNKKKEEQKVEKQKIIQQQLSKVQSFLQQSKRNNKIKNMESQYRYNQLLKQQKEQLVRYEQLLNKNRITLSQKQQLLQMTFKLIKEYPQRVSKQYLQQFLLANHQFCKLFLITKEEIMRDLKVHRTVESQYLNYQQFYQLIKSIQITNKAIKPNLNFSRQQKDNKTKIVKEKEAKSNADKDNQEIQKYLKKVFIYLDQKRQKIVQRQRIEIAFTKCMLFDQKKMKFQKEAISKFGQFVTNQRKREESKKYYKQLDLKYIGLDELIQLYHEYTKNGKYQASQDINTNTQQQQEQSYQEQESVQFFKPTKPKQAQPEEVDTRNDFEKYGWEQEQPEKPKFSHLSQLDTYYKQITNKYGNEIHWNNHKVYQQDFKKFNEAISKMKQKNGSNSKDIVGLSLSQPIVEVDDFETD